MVQKIKEIFNADEHLEISKRQCVSLTNYYDAYSVNPAFDANIVIMDKDILALKESILLLLYRHWWAYNEDDDQKSCLNWFNELKSFYPEFCLKRINDFKSHWFKQGYMPMLMLDSYKKPYNEDMNRFIKSGKFFTIQLLNEILFRERIMECICIYKTSYEHLYLGQTEKSYFLAYDALAD